MLFLPQKSVTVKQQEKIEKNNNNNKEIFLFNLLIHYKYTNTA